MSKDSFEAQVLEPVRGHLQNGNFAMPRLPAPENGDTETWSVVDEEGSRCIQLTIPASVLWGSMQKNAPAAPSFGLCLAAWLEHADQIPTSVRVKVEGYPPRDRNDLQHFRRSMFLLSEYENLLEGRFVVKCDSSCRWHWPKNPCFNVEGKRKGRGRPQRKEARLARALVESLDARRRFSEEMSTILVFHEQLPVGLFDGTVEPENAWTVRGASGVDLWTLSRDRLHMHLFELKTSDKVMLGVLPEALYYVRMVASVRDRPYIELAPSSQGLSTARRSKQFTMWLSAPPDSYHPLLWSPQLEHSAPLAWLNDGLQKHKHGTTLGILPVKEGSDSKPPDWLCAQKWPPS